jgi:protoporphyrinogen/coproporphyrinogen III oxidase
MRVAIIGAGISGLALAYYLQKLGVRYDLFEGETDVGGLIKTETKGPYLLELGPTSLHMTPEVEELVQELKLEDQVLTAATSNQDIFIRKEGQYHGMPSTLRKLLLNPFFHWRTKLKITQEVKRPPQEFPNETVTQFFTRRFGQEVVDYVVQPLVTTLYGGDPEKLLVDKTFPYLKELEREHGSVLRGLDLEEQLNAEPVFTLADGLQTLPHAIASKLVSLHVAHKVEMIHRTKGKYLLSIQHDVESLADEEFDAVVIALPAYAAAELLDFTSPGLAAALHNITYLPSTVVHTAYRKHSVGVPLEGYGAFHPQKEKPYASAAIWRSSLFPNVCPDDEVLFSSMICPGLAQDEIPLPQDEVLLRVHEELKANYNISSNLPVFQHVHHWPQAYPQPDIFITDAHLLAKALEEEQLYACANWIAGPTVRDSITYAKDLAHKIYSQRASLL